jgi:gliding motility-associated-like protein
MIVSGVYSTLLQKAPHNMGHLFRLQKNRNTLRSLLALGLYTCLYLPAPAQCPDNIGFDKGNFSGWVTSKGKIDMVGAFTLTAGSPDFEQHRIFKTGVPEEFDRLTGMPVISPNGSNYSLRLGDVDGGAEIEQVSYQFTIPANQPLYSLIYHYAVVMELPDHVPALNPRFTAKVFNLTTNSYIDCSSFDYTATAGLPGFTTTADKRVVWKPWSAVTLNLNGHAGETIRLEFTAFDCAQGAHAGYAYIDVNENCGSPVGGGTLCMGQDTLRLTGPFGFKEYKWFSKDFSQALGNDDTLSLFPSPPAGTEIALELKPYQNFGCADTLYTTIRWGNDEVKLVLRSSDSACLEPGFNLTDQRLVTGSAPDLYFRYYTDPELTRLLRDADHIITGGSYYVKAIDPAGCFKSRKIDVTINPMPAVPVVSTPPELVKPATLDLSTVFKPVQGISYSFWHDGNATMPLANPKTIDKSGTYYIRATSSSGCSVVAPVTVTIKDAPGTIPVPAPGSPTAPAPVLPKPPNAFSPNGDGFNDVWIIPLLGNFPDCVVEIFSRSGQSLFRSAGYKLPWDGTFNSKPIPIDTYYYIIQLGAGQPGPLSGSVTIIR